MRRRFIFVFLPLLGLAALAFRGPIEALTDHIVGRLAARKVLASWGLAPSPDNVDLYLSVDRSPGGGRTTSADFGGPATPVAAIPDDRRFSDHWSYGQLFEQGRITIGIYNADPLVRARLDRMIRDCSLASSNRITVRWLRSREELIHSFAHDTIVLYFGHANVGKGIVFDEQNKEPPLRMGRETLVVPRRTLAEGDVVLEDLGDGFVQIQGGSQGLQDLVVSCKGFGYLGCRTDSYFREIWKARFPTVDFIATTYACTTVAMAPEILHTLVRGLQEGRTLGEIVHAMNQGQASTILFGRIKETAQYRNRNDHAAVLFTY